MKKNVFFALFAIVALVFVGCEPPVETVDYTVAISTTELTMELDGTQKLTAVVTPATTAYSILWTSDNEAVATVNASGIVTAVGLGTATVTATLQIPEGDATVGAVIPGTCLVSVTNDALYDQFSLGGMALFNLEDPIPGTDTVVLGYDCQMAIGTYYVWDENIVLSGNYLTGAGFLFEMKAPTFVIAKGEYAGYYIGSSSYLVDTIPADEYYAYCSNAGQILDEQIYGDAWNAILGFNENTTDEEVTAAYDLYQSAFTGSQLFYIDFEAGTESYFYGNISYALILENDDNTLSYDLKMEWFDNVNPGRLFGLLVETDVDADGNEYPKAVVEPYDMRYIHKAYNNMPVEEAAASIKMPKKMVKIANAPTKTNNLRSFHVR